MTWADDRAEIKAHYAPDVEERRVATLARFEFLRIWEIIHRYVPAAPTAIADIGGGPGTYALPLAGEGYLVHLLDPVAGHVARVLERSGSAEVRKLASARVGNACELPWEDEAFEVCLLFGPMYHLTAAHERRRALGEVKRVLKPGGLLLATAISRYASTYAGLVMGFLADPMYRTIVERDVEGGQHRNPSRDPRWFTTAYFHHPDEFREEINLSGFEIDQLIAVDGPAGCLDDLAWWIDDDDRREALLAMVRRVESEPSLLGASPQLLAVAQKRRSRWQRRSV